MVFATDATVYVFVRVCEWKAGRSSYGFYFIKNALWHPFIFFTLGYYFTN